MEVPNTRWLGAIGLVWLSGCSACLIGEEERDEIPANLEEAREMLLAEFATGEEIEQDVVVAECLNESLVLTFYFTSPFTWRYDYFDSETGEFVARRDDNAPDVFIPFLPCTTSFYPRLVSCGDGVVITEVLTGTRYEVGEEDVLPNP